ncbi:alpha/beta hydrolase [Kyrpidia spormannii]|uniref:Alpha/beta hydrolase n=1 Tax=Kyrpidia spormannii TaxID=2055160 RepID=A0A2K8N7R0_9BACL|nr:alpha/beta hydrolase [Kyrpidia spormannii]
MTMAKVWINVQVDLGGLRISYEDRGEGFPVLLLHGWGGRAESFRPVTDRLAQGYRVLVPDLPGFGESAPPPSTWGVGDYAKFVLEFMKHVGISRAHVIGHSFGGRIGIVLAATHPDRVARMVLVDAAGIRPRRSWKYYIRVYTFKTLRALYQRLPGKDRDKRLAQLYARFGSKDYREAGPMRAVMVRVINEDLRSFLPRIRASTLLIWGEEDRDTPVWMGKVMEKEIPDAGLVVFPGAGHFSYLDRFADFSVIVERFFKG